MTDAFADLDATACAALIHNRDVTAKELVAAAIARVEAIDPQINALAHRRFEKALAEAADPRLADTPLAGVPSLLKDVDATSAGDPLFAGSAFLKRLNWHEPEDSAVVTQMRKAGLVFVGKSTTPEFALALHTASAAHGVTRNPWNLDLSAGGSSGGAGAAVAARVVPVAHGSDGGGSIRIPASLNGLVGLKPSRGRVPSGPRQATPWLGLISHGVLTRSLRDSALLMDWLSVPDASEPYGTLTTALPYVEEIKRPLGALRVGLLDHTPGGPAIEPDAATAARAAARLLSEGGCRVDDAFPSALAELDPNALTTLVAGWVSYFVDDLIQRTGETPRDGELQLGTVKFAAVGRQIPASTYVATLERVHAWARRVKSWWRDFDLLVTPTMPGPALPIAFHEEIARTFDSEKMRHLTPFTPPWNLTGQPAMSLPLGMSAAGLPIGVQLVAAHGREDILYRAAAFLETAAPWEKRKPAVCAA